VKFKIPVDILKEGRAEIESFPYAPGERSWDGHTLIIKGKKSKYVSAIQKNLHQSVTALTDISIVTTSL
jgi:hypothetical protein